MFFAYRLLAQGNQINFDLQDTGTGGWTIFAITELAIFVFGLIAMWKVFVKAGEPGWAAIIPIYNFIVLLRIAGKPWWWIFLFIIPIVNLVIFIIVSIDVAKNFGQGVGFGLGLAFLSIIFYPILAFGDARYNKVV
jgi:hypothetical protein